MIDITDKNLVVMQDMSMNNGEWIIYESPKLAKKVMAMDSGNHKWIGYIFDGWKYLNTEEVKDRDRSNKAYIHSYSDDKNRIRYISEIVCEPNNYNKAKEPYYIRKVHSVKPSNI